MQNSKSPAEQKQITQAVIDDFVAAGLLETVGERGGKPIYRKKSDEAFRAMWRSRLTRALDWLVADFDGDEEPHWSREKEDELSGAIDAVVLAHLGTSCEIAYPLVDFRDVIAVWKQARRGGAERSERELRWMLDALALTHARDAMEFCGAPIDWQDSADAEGQPRSTEAAAS
jgi:hypothetical protein